MAERWDDLDSRNRQRWEKDARLMVTADPGIQAIEWVDPSSHVRWIMPLAGNEPALNLDLTKEERRRTALLLARSSGRPTLSRTIDLVQGGKGTLLFVPILADGEFHGYILGVFRVNSLMDRVLDRQIAPGCGVTLYEGADEIYSRAAPRTQHEVGLGSDTPVDVYGISWRLRVWPSVSLLRTLSSPVNNVLLGFAASLSLLLGFLVIDVNRRRQAEKGLHESEERFRTLTERAPVAIGMARQGITLYVNRKYLEVYGFESVDEVRGRSIGEQWAPECRAEVEERARQRSAGLPVPTEYEAIGQRKDGSRFPAHAAVTLLQLADGPCTVGFLTDMTRQRRAEQELAKSELYFRSLIENALDITATLDTNAHLTFVSPSVTRLLGFEPGEVIGRSILDFLHPDDHPTAVDRIQRALADETSLREFEVRLRHKNGSWRQIGAIGHLFTGEAGRPSIIINARDLTERKRAERFREATYRISEAAQKAESVDELFRLAHGAVSDLMPAHNFYIALVDRASRILTFPYFVDEVDSAPAPKPMGRGLTDYVIRTGESLLASPDVFEQLVADGEVEPIGAPSIDWLGVPLKTPGETIGAAVVQTYTEGVRYHEVDKDLLTFISNQLALVIQRKAAEEALRRREADLREAQRVAHVGSWDWNAQTGTITWSEELCRIYGVPLSGAPASFEEFLSRFVREDHREALRHLIEKSLKTGEPYQRDTEPVRPDGARLWISATGEARRDAGGRIIGLRGTVQDITERKLAEERSWHQAHHDALTGLPNRLLFNDRLEMAIQRARRQNERLAVMFLDLDDFKQVNDTLGHSVGDELLVLVAERLQRALRREDTLARLGGDEFLIVMGGSKDAASVAVMARKILSVFENPFVAKKRDLFLSGSLGIALCPDDGSDPETLMANVDAAMYRAKRMGRNTFQFFTAEMQRHAQERAALESGLRRALVADELRLHYQPIWELATRRIVGFEALVRWQHPEKGLLLPNAFVSLAEDVGLIIPLGGWVLRQACERTHIWRESGATGLTVAVNLSARQLQHEGFVRQVLEVLRETDLPPTAIDLEITESLAMQSVQATTQVLSQLSAVGIRISIDDFGIGHSSLSYLKHFPIRRLKVDRSFIEGMARDTRDRAIVAGILSIAHSLGVKVVAEGVETAEQASLLATLGCDEAQGFLLGEPVPETEVEKLLIQTP